MILILNHNINHAQLTDLMFDIFIFSFLVALTGALSPGPILTFTIYKSLHQKRGYLAGVYIVLGHATIEFLIVISLLAGLSIVLQNPFVLILLSVFGGCFLIILGVLVIKNVVMKKVSIELSSENDDSRRFKGNSFLGGILLSLSNPFWVFWWAVIGLGFMVNFNVSFSNPMSIIAFFLGHEAGDFAWYLPISLFVYFGGKAVNMKVYRVVLIACGVFMIAFGLYLIINIWNFAFQ